MLYWGGELEIKDHPRSRGVYVPVGARERDDVGIIPARAGFTPVLSGVVPCDEDHPRSRGVYL